MAYLGWDPVVHRFYTDGIEVLGEPERTYLFALLFDYEIRNGGFHQLLHNKEVWETDEMLKALDKLRMLDCCALLRIAIRLVGGAGRQENWRKRQEYMMKNQSVFDEPLGRLNNSYYARYEQEDIYEILRRHVTANGAVFAQYGEEFASGAW